MGVYNTSASHVIGNLDDDSNTATSEGRYPTVMNYQKGTYYHVHAPAKVYPTLDDAVVVTAAAAAWTLGSITEIIPADTITNAFDIHWIVLTDISDVDQYELVLYSGLAESEEEIGRIAFSRNTNFVQEGNLPIQVPVQLSNTRISAALACKSTSDHTSSVKVYYHIYPDQE